MDPELLKLLLQQLASRPDATATQPLATFSPRPKSSIGPPRAGSGFIERGFGLSGLAERKLGELQQEPIAQQLPGGLNLQAVMAALDPTPAGKLGKAAAARKELQKTKGLAESAVERFFADPSARVPGLTGRTAPSRGATILGEKLNMSRVARSEEGDRLLGRVIKGEGQPAVRDPNGVVYTRRVPAEHGDLIEFAQEEGADFAMRQFESGWILNKKFIGVQDVQRRIDFGAQTRGLGR